eukprot:XP_011612914.1 PREDICTED: uncharacterized protein LOC105417912 [Takifugu rubripes]
MNLAHNPSPLRRLERIEGIIQLHEEAVAAAGVETRRAAEAKERALAELSGLLSRLSARLEPTAPPASSVPASAPVIPQQGPEPRVGEPEHCEGNPESYDTFVVNCSLLFSLQPRTFATEAAKVAYTITHLTRRAWLWGTAEWERQSEACSTFSAFATELSEVFGQGNSRSRGGAQAAASVQPVPLLRWIRTFCGDLSTPALRGTSAPHGTPPDLAGVPEQYHDLAEVFSKVRVTSLPPHRPYDCAIDLPPGIAPPKGRLYSLSEPERKAIEEYISSSLSAGLIRLSSSPAGAGFFFVEKDKSLRPCIDYRGLNKITVKNRYPLPLVASAFELLQGATVFTKLDLRNAYNLVHIREGNEWKTAFNTLAGHYETQRACAACAGSTTAATGQLFVKAEKCQFHAPSFLGFIIVPGNIQMDPGSSAAGPLMLLMSTKTEFAWTPEADTAFPELKRWFATAPILQLPDPSRQFVVEADASNTGGSGTVTEGSGGPEAAPVRVLLLLLDAS